MRRKIIRCLFLGLMFLVFVLVFTNSTVWTRGKVITTEPIDSLAFQELVDSVAPRTTIKCLGGWYECYQEEGDVTTTFPIRITKPLRIVAADENNPPIFVGTFDPDYGPWAGGNNCFMVDNLISDIRGLEFEGLHFMGFSRALSFSPSYDPAIPDVPVKAGVLSGLRIDSCQFYDCLRGIGVFDGQIKNFKISDNIIEAARHGIVVQGGVDVPPVGEPYDMGRPNNGTITGNTVFSESVGIDVCGCEGVTVKDNFIDISVDVYGIGIWFGGDWYEELVLDDGPIRIGSVSGNNVQANGAYGIACYGRTTLRKSLIQYNSISDSYLGIILEMGANNFNIVDNEFVNSIWDIDIWLGGEPYWETAPPASHDNTVIANDFVTYVVDNGINNTLVGKIFLWDYSSVLNDVRQNLKELRQKLAERRQR